MYHRDKLNSMIMMIMLTHEEIVVFSNLERIVKPIKEKIKIFQTLKNYLEFFFMYKAFLLSYRQNKGHNLK